MFPPFSLWSISHDSITSFPSPENKQFYFKLHRYIRYIGGHDQQLTRYHLVTAVTDSDRSVELLCRQRRRVVTAFTAEQAATRPAVMLPPAKPELRAAAHAAAGRVVWDPEGGAGRVRVPVLHSLPADLAGCRLHPGARDRIKRVGDLLRAEDGLWLDAGLREGEPGRLQVPPEAGDLGQVTRVDLDQPPLALVVMSDQAIAVQGITVGGLGLAGGWRVKKETFGNRNWNRR